MLKTVWTDKYNKEIKAALLKFLASVSILRPNSLNITGDIKWEKTINFAPKEHNVLKKVQLCFLSGHRWSDLEIPVFGSGTARSRTAEKNLDGVFLLPPKMYCVS